MNKLISMTDFVLEQVRLRKKENLPYETDDYFNSCEKYANFLKQPLKLEMFVPCDGNGNVLEEPSLYHEWNSDEPDEWIFTCHDEVKNCVKFHEAKERVLFEGFRKEYNAIISPDGGYLDESKLKRKIVEDLIGSNNLTLTQSALKQIGFRSSL